MHITRESTTVTSNEDFKEFIEEAGKCVVNKKPMQIAFSTEEGERRNLEVMVESLTKVNDNKGGSQNRWQIEFYCNAVKCYAAIIVDLSANTSRLANTA